MKRLLFLLLPLLLLAALSSAEQTALHTVVPEGHTVSLSLGGHAEAAVGEQLVSDDTAFSVGRFESLRIRVLPEWGYRLDTVSASSSRGLTIEGNDILLSSAVQDLSLSLSFIQDEAPGMALSAADLVLAPGMSAMLSAKMPPAQDTADLVWETSDESVLFVSGGMITARGEGRAVVTARSGDLSAACTVEVRGMHTLTLPNALETVEAGAFRGSQSAECIRLSDGVRSIGAHAFADCTNLRLAVLPSSVESIGEGAFEGCGHLVFLCDETAEAVIRYAKIHGISCVQE